MPIKNHHTTIQNGDSVPTVAFVCLQAFPLFDPSVHGHIGGMETRSALFARGMANTGRWKTLFVVGNYGQDRCLSIDGISFIIYRRLLKPIFDNVVPRFRKHRWRPVIHLDKRDLHFLWHFPAYLIINLLPKCLFNRFWNLMRPDVVCCFGNNPISAEVIADCYRSGIKTVLCIASDDDLSPDYRPGDRRPNDYGTPRWMAWYAVNTADLIMVQTERQRDLLKQHFNRTGKIIHNPVPVPVDARQHWPQRETREFVLWIGRSDTFHKRPLLMLELARACPHIEFMMILNKTNSHVFEMIQRDRPANVTVIERVPHHEILGYYRRARILVSTSAYEGFPNTFLQAAVSGVPVASLNVDPEGILAGRGCGVFVDGDFARFVQAVRTLWHDSVLADQYAETFFNYVFDSFRLDNQVLRLESLLGQLISTPAPVSPPSCWRQPFSRFLPRTGRRD